MLRATAAGVAGVALVAGLAACGADDRDMAEPSDSQTTTSVVRGATTSTAGIGTPAAPLALTSTAFAPDAAIPDRYTCKGMDASPDLAWTNVPAGTVELALVVDDPDANGFVHWVVAGIDPATTGLAENQVPADVVQAKNDFGNAGWAGPCPPAGSGVHHYQFQLLALGAPLNLDPALQGPDAVSAVHGGNVLGTATLVGTVDGG
jgi:Raf kinase inhibitor-like YbhB/YbcL family protein